MDLQLVLITSHSTRQPWHGRSLVTLPTTQRLGLENFTIHPAMPPPQFLPIRIRDDDNKYALRGTDSNDDLSRTPYLAALANQATRTVSLKIVYLPTPLRESFETQIEDCPKGYECTADQWVFDEDDSGDGQILYNLQFAGFTGKWFPFKDAGKEGWHVYWKGDLGVHISVNFDLVPLPQDDARIFRCRPGRFVYVRQVACLNCLNSNATRSLGYKDVSET